VTQLGVGEALVSTLEPDGTPAVVERALIAPPRARIGPVTAAERQAVIERSPVAGKYEQAIDRESAYEHLQGRVEPAASSRPSAAPAERREETPTARAERPERRSNRQSVAEAFAKSTARAIGSQIGRQIVRGMLGAIFKR
jgi:DNA helicase HerA-like ATPase